MDGRDSRHHYGTDHLPAHDCRISDFLKSFISASLAGIRALPFFPVFKRGHAFGIFKHFDEIAGILKTAVQSDTFDGRAGKAEHGFGVGDAFGGQIVSDRGAIDFFIFSGKMEFADKESGR